MNCWVFEILDVAGIPVAMNRTTCNRKCLNQQPVLVLNQRPVLVLDQLPVLVLNQLPVLVLNQPPVLVLNQPPALWLFDDPEKRKGLKDILEAAGLIVHSREEQERLLKDAEDRGKEAAVPSSREPDCPEGTTTDVQAAEGDLPPLICTNS